MEKKNKEKMNFFVKLSSEIIKLKKRKKIPLFFCVSKNKNLNKFIEGKALLKNIPHIALKEYTPGTIRNRKQVQFNNNDMVKLKKFNYIVLFDAHSDAEKELYKLTLPVLNFKDMDNKKKKVWASWLTSII